MDVSGSSGVNSANGRLAMACRCGVRDGVSTRPSCITL